MALVVLTGMGVSHAQEPNPHALWSVYFLAGAEATKKDNWPEAEALFAAAAEQAQLHRPAEPYLTFAKYSLAVSYYQQGRFTDANRTAAPLTLALDRGTVHPDLQESVDALTALGNLFYNQAQNESNDPKRKDLTGDARTKLDDDINEKNFFARQYYQWAFVIDQELLPPDSPELADPALWVGLMDFTLGDYAGAIDSLTQLKRIQEMAAQRERMLSSGSVAYSLGAKRETGPTTNPQASAQDLDIVIGVSYEVVAGQLEKDKPAEAARDFALAEPYLEKHVDNTDFGKRAGVKLLEIYQEHAQVLQALKDPAAVAALEKKEKSLRAKQGEPN
jgi:hypothetical protein